MMAGRPRMSKEGDRSLDAHPESHLHLHITGLLVVTERASELGL